MNGARYRNRRPWCRLTPRGDAQSRRKGAYSRAVPPAQRNRLRPASRVGERLPVALLAVLTLICLATAWNPPAGRKNWALEVVPGLLLVAWQVATFKKFRLSNIVYVGTFLHLLVLIYGGFYSYAHTPLGDWAKETFHLSRNHYDRIGHFALGFFPALLTREILLRKTPLVVGGWLGFLAGSVVFAAGAFWELIEWWTTLVVAGDLGQAFLGSQGDIWDAQWDMFLVGIGAVVALVFFGKFHDRSMRASTELLAASA
jgi:putative membrane protein